LHTLELGAIEHNIAKQALMAGAPMPDRILNAPELKQGLELYFQAFLDLDGERDHSMGVSPIPWSKVKEYAEFYGFDEEQTEDLLFFIRRMDNAHMNRLKSKKKA
jgi:hypothetical protein